MIYCEERTASHAWIAVSIFQIKHDFFGNIIRNHSFGCAFCSKFCEIPIFWVLWYIIFFKYIEKFRKSRRDVNALFIFYTQYALIKNFFYYHGKIFFGAFIFCFIKIHKYCNKWSLSVSCHKCYDLILNHLDTSFYFVFNTNFNDFFNLFLSVIKTGRFKFRCYLFEIFFTAYIYKRCKVCQRETLSAILWACNLCNTLCCNIAGGRKAFRSVNHSLTYHGTVLKHVFKIYKTAVVHVLG